MAHKPDRLSPRRGPYTVGTTPDGNRTLSIAPAQLDSVGPRFSATWFAVELTRESAILCFGQRIGRSVNSRMDIRFSREHLTEVMAGLADFIGQTESRVAPGRVEDWEVESPTPTTGKYLQEDATLMQLAWAGSQAEITFFWVASLDMHKAMQSNRTDNEYRGPQAVATVCLTTGQLLWILLQCKMLLTERRP